MENSNLSNEQKEEKQENSQDKSLNPTKQNINKNENESNEKDNSSKKENPNKIIENQTDKLPIEQIITDVINTNDKNNDNINKTKEISKKNKFEEEKENEVEEEEKRTEEEEIQEKILMERRKEELRKREEHLRKLENDYNSLINNIIITWNTNRENYIKFYDSNVYRRLCYMLNQPCIVCNQEVIVLIFKFLCQYFKFLNDNLSEIPQKEIIFLYWLNAECNLFSKYPKIKNTYNYNIFDENNELISDKLFYYLFKAMLPNEEIENGELNYNYNCMKKYFFEYLIKIGFLENYIKIFLSRKDIISPRNFITFSFFPFYILNYSDKNFILKNNYNLELIKIFTEKMNYFLNESPTIIKNKKDDFLMFLNCLYNYYYLIIFGALGFVLENFEKNYSEELHNFIFCIFNFYEILLKQQKLELRIISISTLSSYSVLYKNFENKLKTQYNSSKNVYEYTKKEFLKFLQKINIFDYIFGENIHEALIERCYEILSFLYKNNSFPQQQISFLWKISQSKYQSINNSIIALFGKLLPEFSIEDCNIILDTMCGASLKEVNEITLKLLENFFLSEHRHEKLLNILFKYSNELSFYEGLSINIIDKSRKILVKLLFNKKYTDDLIKCIKNNLFCLDNNYLLNTNGNIFIEIMNEFIHSEKNENTIDIFKIINENINSFGMLLTYLDEKYSIFPILMNVLLSIKKLYIFFVQEAIQLKNLINEKKNLDINSELDISKIFCKYKQYLNINTNTIEIKEKININEIKKKLNLCSLYPKDIDDIDNYYKIIIDDFINYIKINILVEDMKLEEDDIIFIIFSGFGFSSNKSNYTNILKKIIDNIFSFHEFGNNYIKQNLLDFLFNLLVENCIYIEEKEIFFNFIKNILVYQSNNNYLSLITEENMKYLCLEKILSINVKDLPYSAYEAINLYLIYINDKYGNIVYSQTTNKFVKIKKINILIGFKTLLEFYIYNNDMNISMNALSTLTNIIEVASCDIINRKYILDELFSLLEKYKIKIKENITNGDMKVVLRKILRLISVVNRTKVSINLYDEKDPNNILNLKINNNYFNNNEENKFTDLKVFKGLTVKEFKNELIDKIICENDDVIALFRSIYTCTNANPNMNITSVSQVKEEIKNNNSITLYYNDVILKDDFTLADYDIKSEENILILNSGAQQGGQEFSMSQEQLNEALNQISMVFNERFSEEIMKEALYHQRGDIENTIIYLTDENNVMNLINEYENKNKNEKNDEPKKKEEIICLEENRFNLLLDILNEGDNDLNDCIWDLFSEIKFPDKFIINSIENDFDNINKENNINKKLLILKIVNSIIFDDNNFCKNNKLNKKLKNKWISKFITTESYILQILNLILEIKIDIKNEIIYSQIIDIIINFFVKIFIKIKDLNIQNKININEKENKEEEYGDFDVGEKERDEFIKILSKNNFVKLIYNDIELVLKLCKAQTRTTRKNIIKSIYDIIIEYLKIIPNDINQFLEQENANKNILNILTKENDTEIRKFSLNFFQKLIGVFKKEEKKEEKKEKEEENQENKNEEKNKEEKEEEKGDKKEDKNKEEENKIDIQSSLLKYYYPNLISDEIYHEEFYELYNYLFNLKSIPPNIIQIDKIIEKFLDNLYSFYTNSQNNNKENNNSEKVLKKLNYNLYILCSFSPIYNEFMKKEIDKRISDNKNIIYVIYKCLFEIKRDKNNNLNYLFSDEQLRANSFSLLSNLISIDKKYFDILLQKIIFHHNKIIPKKTDLPIDYPFRETSQKFLGLKNLGATCYLNSLFQQFYMIPIFQKDIFNFNITDISEKNSQISLKDSTIYNMQLSFANLKKSIMSFYPLISFIKSFKQAFNGEPIHFGVQQDTDEFLSILCDKLEKEAKLLGKDNFLENSIKGKITNEIVSLENDYPYYSQTDEEFYRITLDIKGHKNLEDALDAYVKGEILDGDNKYNVEKYKRKISIKKRTSLKKLGNVVIIHLKRFEFDFYTFQKNKLNDYLKFPLQINLKKWTTVYIRKNEVKDNTEINITEEEKDNLNDDKMNYELTGILIHSGSNLQSGHYYSLIKDQESGKWYQFNDSSISEYNIDKDLEHDCFGNIDSKVNQFGKGAYLLFYTKKECIQKNNNYNNEIVINDKILKEVDIENINFFNIKTYANNTYHNFLIKFMNLSLTYFFVDKEDNNDKMEKNINDNNNKNTIKDNDYSLLMTEELKKEVKIYEKIYENKENIINEEENNIILDNISEIYEKYRNEIIKENKINKEGNEIKEKMENINIEIIIESFCYYLFGIVFQYNDKEEKIKDCVLILKKILSKNKSYSLNIMKLIDNNIDIFSDLLFKYGYIDRDMTGINQDLYTFYKILFNSLYSLEKEKYGYITPETYKHFSKKESGSIILENSAKSLFLRVFKKLFCDNLEKSRLEQSRNSLFLNLLLLITIINSESCLISSKYLIQMISIIKNSSGSEYKNQSNTNYKNDEQFNQLYISIFCEIILRCATPWMYQSKKETPYIKFRQNSENPDFNLYPKLPDNWELIISEDFLINYLLLDKNESCGIMLCHLCYENESTSIIIMEIFKKVLKRKYYSYPSIEYINKNAYKLFDINDSFIQVRLETLFELEKNEKENETVFDNFLKIKYQFPIIILEVIFLLTKAMQQYTIIYEYFKKNKNKIKWINDFYLECILDSSNSSQKYNQILNHHPDLFEVIETQFINKLEL